MPFDVIYAVDTSRSMGETFRTADGHRTRFSRLDMAVRLVSEVLDRHDLYGPADRVGVMVYYSGVTGGTEVDVVLPPRPPLASWQSDQGTMSTLGRLKAWGGAELDVLLMHVIRTGAIDEVTKRRTNLVLLTDAPNIPTWKIESIVPNLVQLNIIVDTLALAVNADTYTLSQLCSATRGLFQYVGSEGEVSAQVERVRRTKVSLETEELLIDAAHGLQGRLQNGSGAVPREEVSALTKRIDEQINRLYYEKAQIETDLALRARNHDKAKKTEPTSLDLSMRSQAESFEARIKILREVFEGLTQLRT